MMSALGWTWQVRTDYKKWCQYMSVRSRRGCLNVFPQFRENNIFLQRAKSNSKLQSLFSASEEFSFSVTKMQNGLKTVFSPASRSALHSIALLLSGSLHPPPVEKT